jgi:hypothetical protein
MSFGVASGKLKLVNSGRQQSRSESVAEEIGRRPPMRPQPRLLEACVP